jgi:hypothetical protein
MLGFHLYCFFFNPVAHVCVCVAKTTGPIIKKFFLTLSHRVGIEVATQYIHIFLNQQNSLIYPTAAPLILSFQEEMEFYFRAWFLEFGQF